MGVLNEIVELGYRAKAFVDYVIGKIIRRLRVLSHSQPFRSLYYLDEFFLFFEYFALFDFLKKTYFSEINYYNFTCWARCFC